MKKTLLALALVIAFATTSFASVSFLVAPGVGEGKAAILGIYGTNHNGPGTNSYGRDLDVNDTNNLGLRVAYGLMDNLDLLAAYTQDSMPNIKRIDDPIDSGKQVSGNTSGLGVKYTLEKGLIPLPVDTAVVAGIENSVAAVKCDNMKTTNVGLNSYAIGMVFSKQIDNMMPYGAVSLKNIYKNVGASVTGANNIDWVSGTALAYNIGIMYGIAKDMAIMAEYNIEDQKYGEMNLKSGRKVDDASMITVTGISLGFVYKI